MARKFIPDGDSAFAQMARNFAVIVGKDPVRYGLAERDAREIAHAVQLFRDAMAANFNRRTRSMASVARKDETRAEAERVIRRAAHLIRANDQISAHDKVMVGVKDRPTRLRRRGCPQTAPQLCFKAGVHGSWNTNGKHVIQFFQSDVTGTLAKPADAARLELFVDLVPPGEPIPDRPGRRHGGMMWYLRSYTRSPMKVEYPRSEVPMRVVYWGRWANATGETGPFSQTLAAPIEGSDWSQFALPAPIDDRAEQGRIAQRVVITSARRELPDRVETVDTLRAESSRMLPERVGEERAEAA